jgi:DNA polymerase III delta prime subunit
MNTNQETAPELSPRDLNFLSIIQNQYKKKQLAPFYLISSSEPNDQIDYENLFIKKWLDSVSVSTETHLDLHRMDLFDGVTVKEIEELIKFTQMRPSHLPYKFLIIQSADRLDEIHLNKLLKTLEAPDGESIIFFFTKHKSSMPKTIVGRAFCWSLQNLDKKIHQPLQFNNYLEANNSLNHFRVYCEAIRYKNIPTPINEAWQTLLAKT